MNVKKLDKRYTVEKTHSISSIKLIHTNKYMAYKVILLGNSGVGKTSIFTRLTTNKFNTYDNVATIGGQFVSLVIDDKKLNLWDTAGQERFRSLIPFYIRGAQIVMIVIEATVLSDTKKLTEEIEYWYNYANSQQLAIKHEYLLVINKCDMIEDFTIPHQYLIDNRFYNIIILSCYTGYNVPLLRISLKECVEKLEKMLEPQTFPDREEVSGSWLSFCSIL